VRQILLPKDYVRFKLMGKYATDKAGGAGTLLFDIRERDWSRAVVEALEIDPAWLTPTFEGTAVTGHVTPQAAEATGLRAGTPVMCSSSRTSPANAPCTPIRCRGVPSSG
jgi:xylulokinase